MERKSFTLSFYIALPVTIALVAVAAAFPDAFDDTTRGLKEFIGTEFGWFYILLVSMTVLFCFYFILSPKGKITLGYPGTKPEHSKLSWIAMVFSAGMGIGLIFYGAAEPISHYALSAPEAEVMSAEALSDALKYSFFHWGISAWAIYALVGLALAYFEFRKRERTLISQTLKPLFGSRMDGPAGKVIDALVIIATVAGVATSLGVGAVQINGGLSYLWDIPKAFWVQMVIIIVATVLFVTSSASGVDKGIKRLSNINVALAIVLMIAAFAVGGGVYALENTSASFGEYIRDFFEMSFRTAANGTAAQQEWIQDWTLMYWAWWISWSPFVGVFIAKVSRGRTVREFLTYILLIPTVFSVLWFGIFGSIGIDRAMEDGAIAALPAEQMLFGVFDGLPADTILSAIAIILVFTFFITSADSATLVLGMESENGTLEPRRKTKVVWGILVSAIAAVLLYAGGYSALQNLLMVLALPFAVILALVAISLYKELTFEAKQMGLTITPKRLPIKGVPFRSYDLPVGERIEIFNDRKHFVLIYTLREGEAHTSAIAEELEVTYNQALHVMKALVADGMLVREGSGDKVKYTLTGPGSLRAEYLLNQEDDRDIGNTVEDDSGEGQEEQEQGPAYRF